MTEAHRPRVAFVTGEYPPQVGGVGDHVALLRETLEQMGVTTWVITGTTPELEVDHPRTARMMRRWGFSRMTALMRRLQEINPDVVHLQYQSGAFGLSAAANLIPRFIRMGRVEAKTVTTLHDLRTPYVFPKAGMLRRFLVRRTAKDSDGVIFVSPEDARELMKQDLPIGEVSLLDSTVASVIPVGPTILPVGIGDDREALRAELGLPPRAFIVGHIGFRQRNKGMRVLGDALRQTQQLQGDLVLALIGSGEPPGDGRRHDRGERTDNIGQWQVVESGWLEPTGMSHWLQCCDLCVLPFADGLSLRRSTFMSAIAHGLPVVTTRPAQSFPGLESGENVILVPPGDATSLSYAISQFAGSVPMHHDYGERVRQLSERFSWEANAGATLALYHAVTDVG
ncbi:MAG TPA: glycosyltransferase family 4 protein [Chloroflexota bacterium]|nr:glycosyltransferase family 4 protein [Chloroflexota bacterium]